MKDSILVLVVFASLAGGFYILRQIHDANHVSVATAAAPANSSPAKKSSTTSAQVFKSKGDSKHESSNHRSRKQVRHPRKSKAAAVEAREDDSSFASLPSIYEGEGSGGSAVREREQSRTALTADDSSAPKPSGTPTVIAGVPVAAWVAANRNRLQGAEITAAESNKLNVYLWCMEMKTGGPRYTGEKKCKDIVMSQGENRTPGPRNTY